MGKDSDNVTYWYFYGTRLYKEVPTIKSDDKKKKKKKRKKDKKDKKKKKKKYHRDSVSSGDEDEGGEPGTVWSVACLSQQDWEDLTEKYKKSKKKGDKDLFETLSESFLPEIRKMFAEKEREERRKLLMLQPKRASNRIERKRLDQEEKDRQFALQVKQLTRQVSSVICEKLLYLIFP